MLLLISIFENEKLYITLNLINKMILKILLNLLNRKILLCILYKKQIMEYCYIYSLFCRLMYNVDLDYCYLNCLLRLELIPLIFFYDIFNLKFYIYILFVLFFLLIKIYSDKKTKFKYKKLYQINN